MKKTKRSKRPNSPPTQALWHTISLNFYGIYSDRNSLLLYNVKKTIQVFLNCTASHIKKFITINNKPGQLVMLVYQLLMCISMPHPFIAPENRNTLN